MSIDCKDNVLERRPTYQVELRGENATVVRVPAQRALSGQREDLPYVQKGQPLCQSLQDLSLLESSTSSGESSRKLRASRNTRILGNPQMDHTHSDVREDLYILSLDQMEMNRWTTLSMMSVRICTFCP